MNYLANINDKDLTVVILAEVLRRMGTKYFSYFFHVQICILEVRTIFFNFLHCGPVIITLPTTIADKNFHGDKYNIPAYPDVLVNFFFSISVLLHTIHFITFSFHIRPTDPGPGDTR
jgi:hypothetical protein